MSRDRLALSMLMLVLVIFGLGLTFDAYSGEVSSPNLEIFVVNADGSGRRNLTRNPAQDDHPALSPDGRTVAFDRGGASLSVMASNGTRKRELLRLTRLARPDWSHDGGLIAFTSCVDLTPGGCKVGVLGGNGTGLLWIPEAADPSWTATGRRLVFRTDFGPGFREGSRAIAIANADGSDRRIVARASDFMEHELLRPVSSPKGSTIAFDAYTSSFPLYVSNLEQAAPARLIAHGYNPAWSPDGRRLAFTNAEDLWTVRADGSGLRRLPRMRSSEIPRLPSWSPDGTRIAFVTRPLATRILVVINLRRRSFRVVATGVESRQPVWSRDGRKIYFVGLGHA